MRSRNFVAALLLILGSAGSASAQVLSLEFHDGRVKLKAENVPVSRILAEWARLGGTQIINGERIPGAPLTLQLDDTPERQALEIVLRDAAGYMVLGRDASSTGASAFAKIMVLPTTSRAPAAAALPTPTPPVPQFREPQFREPEPEVEEDQPPATPPPVFRRGRVPNNTLPPVGGNIPDNPDDDVSPEGEDGEESEPPPPPPPGNPFGVVPGGARPGTINPRPPRGAGENEPIEQTPR
jgi:hypothetical protein